MYALNKLEGKTVLLVCGAPGNDELIRITKALEIAKEDVKFVTEHEMRAVGNVAIEKLAIEIKHLAMPYEPIFTEKPKKPHLDRNVRRASRKSRW